MATTTLKMVIDRCKITLQEITSDGTRWSNAELVDWAGEFYQFSASISPGEFSEIRQLSCVAGTMQQAPADMVQLIDVTRNLDGSKMPIVATTKNVLDSTRRGWHSEVPTNSQEVFILDERYPRQFFVWPPAQAGSLIEIAGVVVPAKHSLTDYTVGTETVKCSDRLVPPMVDYILFRAYSKDADFAGNANRANAHYTTCINALQIGRETRYQVAPIPSGSAAG